MLDMIVNAYNATVDFVAETYDSIVGNETVKTVVKSDTAKGAVIGAATGAVMFTASATIAMVLILLGVYTLTVSWGAFFVYLGYTLVEYLVAYSILGIALGALSDLFVTYEKDMVAA